MVQIAECQWLMREMFLYPQRQVEPLQVDVRHLQSEGPETGIGPPE